MRKHLLKAGSWLGNIKISLFPVPAVFPEVQVPNSGLSLMLPHFRLNEQTSAGVMNGTGEADPLEIVRSEVRLPHLESFVMAPLSDLLTHILNYIHHL